MPAQLCNDRLHLQKTKLVHLESFFSLLTEMNELTVLHYGPVWCHSGLLTK